MVHISSGFVLNSFYTDYYGLFEYYENGWTYQDITMLRCWIISHTSF
jgi:hypothetical protein